MRRRSRSSARPRRRACGRARTPSAGSCAAGRGATAPPITVVGVAADARHRGRFRFSQGAAAHEPQLDVYLPYAQRPNALVTLGIRTHGAAGALHQRRASRDRRRSIRRCRSTTSRRSSNRMRDEEAPVGFRGAAAQPVRRAGDPAGGDRRLRRAGGGRREPDARARHSQPRSARSRAGWLPGVVAEGLIVSLAAIGIGVVAAWALAAIVRRSVVRRNRHTGNRAVAARPRS